MASTMTILQELLKRYTQEELSRRLEVSLRSIQNYVTGTEPRKEVARKMRELLDSPVLVKDAENLMMQKLIRMEAMQKVQLTVLQELFAKALNIPNMEAGAIIDKTLGQELQKSKEELQS